MYNKAPEGYKAKAGSDDKKIIESLEVDAEDELVTTFEKVVNPKTGDNNIGIILFFGGLAFLSLVLIFGIVFRKIKHKNITTFLACFLVIGITMLAFSGNAFAEEESTEKEIISKSILAKVENDEVEINSFVTYDKPACIAAGTMITMGNGEQKLVEEVEVGDVIRTFDHNKGEVSSAPVAYVWESKNAANGFTLTFEDDTKVTVIEEHGFYDQEEKKYAFINAQNAKDYIGHNFYNADNGEWLKLVNYEILDDRIDAYAIISYQQLNHLSNGMLSMCDGTVKLLANIFAYDDQMKFDADEIASDIEKYGLTPEEKIMELEGFYEGDYDTYNLQYLDIAIGKGLTSWEKIKALGEYFAANGI